LPTSASSLVFRENPYGGAITARGKQLMR
jgi:hypothetical protein